MIPKANELLEKAIVRATAQLEDAYPRMKARGLTHQFTVTSEKKIYDDCISAHGIVIRQNEYGELLYHVKSDTWYPLSSSATGDVVNIIRASDYLLKVSKGLIKQPK